MKLSELVEAMANLAIQKLEEQRFGKKRAQELNQTLEHNYNNVPKSGHDVVAEPFVMKSVINKLVDNERSLMKIPTQEMNNTNSNQSKNPRYISNKLKHHIWLRDQAQCTKCGSQRNIQFDHIHPVALGGKSDSQNLRLLCFHCNQRQRITAGLGSVHLNFL